ncbi:MAG: phosphoribosylformylglycinamidine synthase, partial [Firmicutes bacterium]|nr:phosphoribosylformylglycinamidine synthase [Bacillota bacterium]
MSITRFFVEKKSEHRTPTLTLKSDIESVLGVQIDDLRVVLRYDIEGVTGESLEKSKTTVFCEPPVDILTQSSSYNFGAEYKVFGVELLPGQYDQRADSAAQCMQLLSQGDRPIVRCATIYAIKTSADIAKIKNYLINPIEARECSLDMPKSLSLQAAEPAPVKLIDGFVDWSEAQIKAYHKDMGFAMNLADLLFVQKHFKDEYRNPTETELKVIDTYWSDHCRHTTFFTRLKKVQIDSKIGEIQDTFNEYLALFNKHYQGRADKYPSLMDIATMGARELKARGKVPNLDISDEINACTIRVMADIDGEAEEWIVMFKNETHNHPTEIEPFGGAATALGGGIRDPLSGRVYVYHSMRVTGAGDITAPLKNTLKGKLPQRVISKTATAGFSSYANQVGLAAGIIQEYFHPGYVAKRLETGFTVGAAPSKNVVRGVPEAGDVVLLVGGETGRDGCGGATGSSKTQTVDSLEVCGAEVQKGNPLIGRKLQRVFRNPKLSTLIKRCNDFGAGGVSVAVGELSSGLDIFLEKVPAKYVGLSATEVAISESQERMAIVVNKKNVEKVVELCAEENLDATVIADITDTKRMRMYHKGNLIVDLKREFLDTNGVAQVMQASIKEKPVQYFDTIEKEVAVAFKKQGGAAALKASLQLDNAASQKGMGENFDATVGAGTVILPFGGKYLLTPAINMAAKLPVLKGETDTCTVCANGFDPFLSSESPFTGANYAVLSSVIKVVLAGVPLSSIRLTFQEYFERLRDVPERWGKPTSALLGALHVQLGLELASIGGKDSMSGSFEKIDVPPTLISFALGIGKASELISNVLARAGQKIYRYRLPKSASHIPDMQAVKEFLNLLQGEISRGLVDYATIVEVGGAATAIAKSCFGNGFGFKFVNKNIDLFTPKWGDILFSTNTPEDFVGYSLDYVGEVIEEQKFVFGGNDEISTKDALEAFESKYAKVYPTTAKADGRAENVNFEKKQVGILVSDQPQIVGDDGNRPDSGTAKPIKGKTTKGKKESTNKKTSAKGKGTKAKTGDRAAKANTKSITTQKVSLGKPVVLIPVFPGTNCEYDMMRKFEKAGAEVDLFVIKNRNEQDIQESILAMEKKIKNANILSLAGGFSAGDEPGGSGKFIAAFFKNQRLMDAVNELLLKRDGLAIGICNGFQALIKLGLLPNGAITESTDISPTLTFNNIARHVATISYIRIASTLSPWLKNCKVGEVYINPVSHGEGKLVAIEKDIKAWIDNGQIATQYSDLENIATMQSPFNPNGAQMAIEGITSPDGRVFGKMGHSERVGTNLMKNLNHP